MTKALRRPAALAALAGTALLLSGCGGGLLPEQKVQTANPFQT